MKPKGIYYICPDMPVQSGGVSMIYDHVISLNKLGYNAYVVHFSSEFKKIPWRKFGKDISFLKVHYIDKLFNTTKQNDGGSQIVSSNYEFSENDIIVIPEGFPQFAPIFKQNLNLKAKIWMFAQGWLYLIPAMQSAFQGQIVNPKQFGCEGVITVGSQVSRYIKDMFKYTDDEVKQVSNFVDSSIFNMNLGTEEVEEVVETEEGDLDIAMVTKEKEKKNKIAFMPRKGMEKWYGILLSLSQAMGITSGWEFTPIVNMNQEQVAEVLKDSKIFINFTEGEGFGLPALESIMCGCLYVGNAGLGSLEFLDGLKTSFHNLINDCNDPYQWINALKSAVELTNSEDYKTTIKEASDNVSSVYTYDNFVKQLNRAYDFENQSNAV